MCHSRAYVYKHLAEDIDDQICSTVDIVEGSIFPQGIADSEHHRTERVQPDHLEAFVSTGPGSECLIEQRL